MVLMLMVSISSLAVADEEENVDDETDLEDEEPIDYETKEELEIMNNSFGAEIRLLQLEKALAKNILKGEMTVEVLVSLEYNTTDLQAILEEMKLVLEEVQSADPESNESVEIFVDLKSDAKNLTTQFREKLKELLSDVKYKEIKEMVKENASEELENYSKQIRNRIKQFNRNQIYRLYGLLDEDVNNSFVNQYMNGTMELNQVKIQLNKMVNAKIKEKRMEIFQKIIKEKIQQKNNANQNAKNATANFTVRQEERLQKRLQHANNSGNERLIEMIQNKISNDFGNGNKANGSNNENSANGKGSGKGNN